LGNGCGAEVGPLPSSQFGQISPLAWLIRELNPQSVLDIGPGFGKYGFLAREYLELWFRTTDYAKRTRRIDAIEVFGPYVTPLQRSIYNEIRIGDAIRVLPQLATYDLVLLIDVLEHVDKADGIRLITVSLQKGTFVIVSTPKNPAPQAAQFGNIHERHRSAWTRRELTSIAPTLFLQEPQSLVALLSMSKDRVAEMRSTILFMNVYHNMPVPVRRLLSRRLAPRAR
jgi:2-polyprenyl-3-methyl-5-hydroxy-6-metoxy-1,4-benzoquinol methylase